MSSFLAEVQKKRGIAVHKAEKELENRGFRQTKKRIWSGQLALENDEKVSIEVLLTTDFPESLPCITIAEGEIDRQIPHLDWVESEKLFVVCLTTKSVVIDESRPEDIIGFALSATQKILIEGMAGALDKDFAEEYGYYWQSLGKDKIINLCEPENMENEVFIFRAYSEDVDKGRARIVRLAASSQASAWEWARRAGYKLDSKGIALVVKTTKLLPIPIHNKAWSVQDFFEFLKDAMTGAAFADLLERVSRSPFPLSMLIQFPAPGGIGLVAADIPLVNRERRRKQAAPSGAIVSELPKELRSYAPFSITRTTINRIDRKHLLPRGGADGTLKDRSVTIIGCGAVGSHIAGQLAGAGLGLLRLIDNEPLNFENVYRHLMGANSVGMRKVIAVKKGLEDKFPHLDIEVLDTDVSQDSFCRDKFALGSDLIVIALGAPQLEFKLSDYFRMEGKRIIHAWVEPLGVGGHILMSGKPNAPGCIRCLYRLDDKYGIVNWASFLQAGQIVEKTLNGCQGLFTPYSYLDASHTGLLTSRLVLAALKDPNNKERELISWFGDDSECLKVGLELSERIRLFVKQQVVSNDYAKHNVCDGCS